MVASEVHLAAAILLVASSWLASAIPIDNGVKGYPHVNCGPHSISVDVDTEKPFQGRIYVKGESERKECVRAFSGEALRGPAKHFGRRDRLNHGIPPPGAPQPYGGKVGLELKFGECNMRRQRTLHPRGVEYTFTMVVSFHPLFLTKVDRAYRVRCFYMEAVKTVATQIDVSMLTTKQVNQQFPMPKCHYHLKKDGYDGPYVRYAKVGDKVTHVWECDKVAGYVFGILVHTCYVDDGQGNKVNLIDEKGCAVDQHLVPQLTYDDHLISAHVKTHVFKYADKPHLFFTCTIQLCFKEDGGCYGITPPKCPGYPGAHLPHGGPLPPPPPPPVIASRHSLPPKPAYAPPPPYDPTPGPHYSPRLPKVYAPHQIPRPIGIKPLAPVGRFPYKDEPDKEEQRLKRAIDDADMDETREKIETDLSAPALIVLPFDVDDDEVDTSGKDALVKLSSSGAAQTFARHYNGYFPTAVRPADGVCMSSSGFGIMTALFVALILFSACLTVLTVRKQWTPPSSTKA